MKDAPGGNRLGLLDGKVALVVGASRGIGAVTAKVLARAGAKVMLAARDGNALEPVVGEIRGEGHEARSVTVDVGDESSVEQLIKRVLDDFGRLDVAFNNATDGSIPQALADMDVDDFDRAIRTNIRGTFLGMKHQIPAMLASGGGSIINMASLAGVQGVANLPIIWKRPVSRRNGRPHWRRRCGASAPPRRSQTRFFGSVRTRAAS